MNISEIFYSIQGEGPSVGRPSIFLRVATCNLSCKWCDTKDIMHIKNSNKIEVRELSSIIQKLSYDNRCSNLVITGGEPLLVQNDLIELLSIFEYNLTYFNKIEIESNATVFPEEGLIKHIDQFNFSPKLSSAQSKYVFCSSIIEKFVDLAKKNKVVCFKFVVSDKQDIVEIIETYSRIVPRELIWLMPCGASQEELRGAYPIVADYCKSFGFNFSPRLHVDIWDKKTGV